MAARWASQVGTLLPVFLCVALVCALLSAGDGLLGWERPLLYEAVSISALFGFWGLISLARRPFGEHVSAVLLALIYQKAFLFIFWQSAAILTFRSPAQPVGGAWSEIAYVLLLESSASMIVVNAILFLCRNDGLAQEADPVPLRPVFKFLKGRRNGDA